MPPMQPKPTHLGPAYAAQFQDASVVDAYQHRPPYPAEVFDVLVGLLVPMRPCAVLDIGCGRGELARPLAARSDAIDHVDAVDISLPMLTLGRSLPGGDTPRLRWLHAALEDAALDSAPYALVTAGASLHWMDWALVLPRLRAALTSGGRLAIVEHDRAAPLPWDATLYGELIPRYTTNRDYQPYDLVQELQARGLFAPQGEHFTAPVPFTQTVDVYIESFHSRNGFSRERMSAADAAAFDAGVRARVAPHLDGALVQMEVVAKITWGLPGVT